MLVSPLPLMGRGRGWGETSTRADTLGGFTPTQPSPIKGEGFKVERNVTHDSDHPYASWTCTMASISTATPSGSTGTPTALRAWRPGSPNTCCISADAPLATFA